MKYNQRAGQYQSTTFFSISSDFKFKQILTFNKHKNLHIIQGQLVYNNGAIVTLSVSHQNLLQRTLNGQFNQSKQKIVFSIDSNRESLAYSGKIVDLPKGFCEVWANECQREVVSKKSKIVHFLAVIGFQIDCQNELMKRIIFQKRDLHQKLEELIGKGNGLKPNYTIQQIMVNENDESNVIFYGPNENLRIQIDKTSMIQGQKKVQGGYFSVQSQECILRNKNNQVQRVTLCRKTLRTEKKTQEYVRQTNQRKLKKQIQIVRSIKNKKYLLKYYCKRDLNNLQEILMQKCEYSLQEYINYFADSLEIKHKILIAQQIIQAVLILHAQGVVHRDIKPSNFLISDRSCRRDYYQLKIIDFAQSYSKNVDLYEGDYACSHPYSPLECSEFKPNSAQRLEQGIKNKEIDYWSVGMIIYQIFFRKLPLSFSRIFHHDIAASWKSELLLTVNERQKYGLAVVQDIVTILCIKMVKVEQTRRMKLETAMSILNILERYVNNLMKIAQEAQ